MNSRLPDGPCLCGALDCRACRGSDAYDPDIEAEDQREDHKMRALVDEGLSPDSAFDALMQDQTTVDEAAMDFTPEAVQAICQSVIAAYRAAKFDNAIDDASAAQIGHAYYSAIYTVIKSHAEGV